MWWMICKGADDQFWLRSNADGDALCQKRRSDWQGFNGSNLVGAIALNHAIQPRLLRMSSKAIQEAVGLPFHYGKIPVVYGPALMSAFTGAHGILFGNQEAAKLLWEKGSEYL